jgi:hypothetical protein
MAGSLLSDGKIPDPYFAGLPPPVPAPAPPVGFPPVPPLVVALPPQPMANVAKKAATRVVAINFFTVEPSFQ